MCNHSLRIRRSSRPIAIQCDSELCADAVQGVRVAEAAGLRDYRHAVPRAAADPGPGDVGFRLSGQGQAVDCQALQAGVGGVAADQEQGQRALRSRFERTGGDGGEGRRDRLGIRGREAGARFLRRRRTQKQILAAVECCRGLRRGGGAACPAAATCQRAS